MNHEDASKSTESSNEETVVMDRDDQMILSLLTAIDDEPDTTQKDLSTQMGVAVGMINSYLKRVIYKGYVKTKQLERRRLRYLLTPKGLREKTRLTYEFLQYSYQYIRKVRTRVHEKMKPYVRQKKTRVIFWGSGEVAELAYLASREMGLQLIAMVDPENAGKRCVDKTVLHSDDVGNELQADVLLVLAPPPKDAQSKKQIEQFATLHGLDSVYVL